MYYTIGKSLQDFATWAPVRFMGQLGGTDLRISDVGNSSATMCFGCEVEFCSTKPSVNLVRHRAKGRSMHTTPDITATFQLKKFDLPSSHVPGTALVCGRIPPSVEAQRLSEGANR